MSKQLVIQNSSKVIENSGTENVIFTEQYAKGVDNINTEEIVMHTMKATINEETFIAKIGGTIEYSEYIFEYKKVGSFYNWYLGETFVGSYSGLALYGITLDYSDYAVGDKIIVYCDMDNNKVISTNYERHQTICIITLKEPTDYYNYLSISCEKSNIEFVLKQNNEDYFINFNTKFEMFKSFTNLTIIAKSQEYFEQSTIKIIYAKVEQ